MSTSKSEKKRSRPATADPRPFHEADDLVEPQLVTPQPIALESEPLVFGGFIGDGSSYHKEFRPLARQMVPASILLPEYQLKTKLAKKRSSSEAGKRNSLRLAKASRATSPSDTQEICVKAVDLVPLDCSEQAPLHATLQKDILAENKNLKQQINELQNVIVSMCVLNQRQTLPTTPQAAALLPYSSMPSIAKSAKLKTSTAMVKTKNCSASALPHALPIATPDLSTSSKKLGEPHPESLQIEPISKPNLVSNWCQDKLPSGSFSQGYASQLPANGKILGSEEKIEAATYIQTPGAVSQQLGLVPQQTFLELRHKDIDLKPGCGGKILTSNGSALTMMSRTSAVTGQRSSLSYHKSRNVQNQNTKGSLRTPNYLKKTVSSQAKMVKTQSNLAQSVKRQPQNACRSQKEDSLAAQKRNMRSGSSLLLNSSTNELLLMTEADASSLHASVQASDATSLNHGSQQAVMSSLEMTKATRVSRNFAHLSTTSQFSSKARSSQKTTSAKRQEFNDLTKKQNRLTQSSASTKVNAQILKPQPTIHYAQTIKATKKLEGKFHFDKKNLPNIIGKQNLKKQQKEIELRHQLETVKSQKNRLQMQLEKTRSLYEAKQHTTPFSSQGSHIEKSFKPEREASQSPSLSQAELSLLNAQDYVEGTMPNTAKFDSASKKQVTSQESGTDQPETQLIKKQDQEDDASSQEEVQRMLLQRMVFQSPLKSGPSTMNGSAYESPMRVPGTNSTTKKVVVPRLNFEKVYEQQRLILEQEERRRKEEEKRQLLLKQQELKAKSFQNSASAKKNLQLTLSNHKKGKQTSTKKVIVHESLSSTNFENSPETKLKYNIVEESNAKVHVYGSSTDVQLSKQGASRLNNFETIVKVDRKTEEKLNKLHSIETSAPQSKHKSSSKQDYNTVSLTQIDAPDEPMQKVPEAFKAPNRPVDFQSKIFRAAQHKVDTTKLSLSKIWNKKEARTSIQTPASCKFQQTDLQTNIANQVKALQKRPSTRQPSGRSRNQSKHGTAEKAKAVARVAVSGKRKQVFHQSGPKRAQVTPKQMQQTRPSQGPGRRDTTPKSQLSQNTNGSDYLSKPRSFSASLHNMVSTNKTKELEAPLHEPNKDLDFAPDDSFNAKQSRSKTRNIRDELMQPILSQARVRIQSSQTKQIQMPCSTFHDQLTAFDQFSPMSMNLHSATNCGSLFNKEVVPFFAHKATINGAAPGRTPNRATPQRGSVLTQGYSHPNDSHPATVKAQQLKAFDNSDISDQLLVDKNLICLSSTAIQPSILTGPQPDPSRKENVALLQPAMLSSHNTTVNTPSTGVNTNNSRQQRRSSLADTVSSLHKKQSGMLARKASEIGQQRSRGRVWKF